MPLAEKSPCGKRHAFCRACRPEVGAHIAAAQRGVPKSPEHAAAVAAARRGVPLSPDHRAAISDGMRESEKHRAAISRRVPLSFKHRQAISRGQPHGPREQPIPPSPDEFPVDRFGAHIVPPSPPPPSSPDRSQTDRFGQPTPTGIVTHAFPRGETRGRGQLSGDAESGFTGWNECWVQVDGGEEIHARTARGVEVKAGDRVQLRLGRGHGVDQVVAVVPR